MFDLYFRENPFGGEFTLFGGAPLPCSTPPRMLTPLPPVAGLEEAVRLVRTLHFSKEGECAAPAGGRPHSAHCAADVAYLRECMPPDTEAAFFDYLAAIDGSKVTLHAIPEGTVVFPKEPLIVVEGPLLVVQLLETPLLTLVNFASLVATNAARYRHAVGPDIKLLEFGLRRAQGPDGGLSASRYCYVGGFNATSNVLAGKMFGIPVAGTHAHAYVTSFAAGVDAAALSLKHQDGEAECDDFFGVVKRWSGELLKHAAEDSDAGLDVNQGELLAFATYAFAFPGNFLALVDTYDVLKSGAPAFVAVALALDQLGYRAKGIRLDSGDLAYLSTRCRAYFRTVAARFEAAWLAEVDIVASNDINEGTLYSLAQQGHSITAFGVGTHLVTCQAQPALGCVFKLVELNGQPRMKLSQDVNKVTIPGRKKIYRLSGKDGYPLVDVMTMASEPPPKPGRRLLVRHPFVESKRAYVVPSTVEPLHAVQWGGGRLEAPIPTITELKARVDTNVSRLRSDHIRALNPTPYKVSVTDALYRHVHQLWLSQAPVGELT